MTAISDPGETADAPGDERWGETLRRDSDVKVTELRHRIKELEDEIAALEERLQLSSAKGGNFLEEKQAAPCADKVTDEFRQSAKRSLFRMNHQVITCPQCHKSASFDLREPNHNHQCSSCGRVLSIRWVDDSTLAIRPLLD